MEIKHYQNQFKSVPIHQFVKDFGHSNTDISTWRPTIGSVRAFLAGSINSGKTLLYDFPDGKDSGEFVQTFIRSKGLDITEIENAEKRITQIIENKKERDKESAEEKANDELLGKAFKKLAGEDSSKSDNQSDNSKSTNNA